MKFLALITFVITEPHSGHQTTIATQFSTECRLVAEQVVAEFEADGFAVDYHCHYTRAPVRSMRPVARPVIHNT